MRGYVTQKKGNMKWYPVIYLGVDELTGKKQYKWGPKQDTRRQAESGLTDLLIKYKLTPDEVQVHNGKDWRTLQEVFDEWKEICKGEKLYSSSESYDTAVGNVQNHVMAALGDAIIDRIEQKHIRQTFASMKNRRKDGKGKLLSEATKKKIMGTLNHVFDYAIECGWCEKNPCIGVKIKTPDIPPKTIWLIEDIDFFLGWVHKNEKYHYYLAYLLLATTAMRRGEVGELRYQDMGMDADLTISRATTAHREVKDIKTGSRGRRTIKIFSLVEDAISFQKKRQQQIADKYLNKSGIRGRVKPWDYIVTDDQNFPVGLQDLTRTFKSCINRINEGGEYYLIPMPLKNLRHCFATHGLSHGVNVPDMQAQLGHSRPSTTQNSYNQYMETMQKANRDKMEQLYFGKRQEKRQEKLAAKE